MNNNTLVVIMAGGFGTRFQKVSRAIAAENPRLFGIVEDIPKPMAVIDGIPVLEREIINLRKQGFTNILLTVSHLKEVIKQYFKDGSGISPATGQVFGVHIEYFEEDLPLGNAGALWKCYDCLTPHFLLLNADSIFDIDFNRILNYHKEKKALATLFVHPNSHPYDSGLIVTSDEVQGRVNSWITKEEPRPKTYNNLVNAGIHVLSKEALDIAAGISAINPTLIGKKNEEDGQTYKVDLDRQILKPLCKSGKVYAYRSPEYVKDMGTPERFEAVVRDFRRGVVVEKNLKNKQKAIFLDRDGTINQYVGFLRDAEEFELIPGVVEAIKSINASGYLAVVVTNQPVIARGEVSYEGLNGIHKKMETLLGKAGAYIDGLYFCPHHPDKGFEGEVSELKIKCNCRKPNSGMLLDAAQDLNIDLSQSWMIGDGKNDVQCGKNLGVNTILLTGEGTASKQQDIVNKKICYGQDFTCKSLLEAVRIILRKS